jgi:hypothetical protein
VRLQKGYNPESALETLYPDENNRFTIEIKELERVMVYLADPENQHDAGEYKIRPYKGIQDLGRGEPCVHPAFSGSMNSLNTQHLTLKNTPSPYYCGYLTDGARLKPLPIGSTLDAVGGVFYWQPGPGFLGDFPLVFFTNTGGELKRTIITVRIQ